MKHKQQKKRSNTSTHKKTSYIGVLTFVIAGLISILSIRHTTQMILPSEKQLTVTLPPAPAAELVPPTPAAQPTPAQPTTQTTEPEVAPVSAQPVPFSITHPPQGDIIKPFSNDTLLYSKTTSDWRTHNGIDFSATVAKDVFAAADGIVEKVYEDSLMGHTVIVIHQDEFRTIYQNLTPNIAVAEGDAVTGGQTIGEAGSSALIELQDVPHLHFSLSQNNKVINPLDYFSNEE